jgi:hypothetical protein
VHATHEVGGSALPRERAHSATNKQVGGLRT